MIPLFEPIEKELVVWSVPLFKTMLFSVTDPGVPPKLDEFEATTVPPSIVVWPL